MRLVTNDWLGEHWCLKVAGIECRINVDKWTRRGDSQSQSWEGYAWWGRHGEAYFGLCETPHEVARELTRHVRAEARFWKRWQAPQKGGK